jgi:hypothetical protein
MFPRDKKFGAVLLMKVFSGMCIVGCVLSGQAGQDE